MTFEDMTVVERYVADKGHRLPVMLSGVYDRVDIETPGLGEGEVAALVDGLAQALGRKGYVWDVWTEPGDSVIHVSERETEEE